MWFIEIVLDSTAGLKAHEFTRVFQLTRAISLVFVKLTRLVDIFYSSSHFQSSELKFERKIVCI